MFKVKDTSKYVTEWCRKYADSGISGLCSKKRGAISEDRRRLHKEQERIIQKKIIDTMSEQLKLLYALWIRKAVKELVKQEFGIVLSISAIGVYLRSWAYPAKA